MPWQAVEAPSWAKKLHLGTSLAEMSFGTINSSCSAVVRSLTDVNRSAACWRYPDSQLAELHRRHHAAARLACRKQSRQTLAEGGWCLERMSHDRLFGEDRVVQLGDGTSFRLPGSHVEADELILSQLADLTNDGGVASAGGALQSIIDFGAGVGQYGHALRSRGARVRWHGYDGAGDVTDFTHGFVSFADLTLPLALPKADWVVSLEVGEHVPREHEMMYLRNLHAHACRGVVLSWACYGGHQHVNRRPNEYVIRTFEQLGYRYDAHTSHEMRKPALRAQLGRNRSAEVSNRVFSWFARSVMVFRRIHPMHADQPHGGTRGCLSDSYAQAARARPGHPLWRTAGWRRPAGQAVSAF